MKVEEVKKKKGDPLQEDTSGATKVWSLVQIYKKKLRALILSHLCLHNFH